MITVVSCGRSNGPPPHGDLVFDCTTMPDPSPIVQDISGRDPVVLEIMARNNPMVGTVMDFLFVEVNKLAAHQEEVGLVLVCSAGWHRSVAVAEELARRLAGHHPEGIRVIHRDLVGAL